MPESLGCPSRLRCGYGNCMRRPVAVAGADDDIDINMGTTAHIAWPCPHEGPRSLAYCAHAIANAEGHPSRSAKVVFYGSGSCLWSVVEYYRVLLLRMNYCTCMDYGGGSLPTRPGFEHAMYRGRYRKHQNSLVNLYSSRTAGFVRPSRSCLVSASLPMLSDNK